MNRSTLQVLGCYILWGLLPVFWKLLAGVNAAYVLAQRIVFSCLFCYAFIWIKKDGPAVRAILRDKKQRRLYLCCGLLISANWGVYILTVATGRILEASLAYYMNPLFSILIGALIFRDICSGTARQDIIQTVQAVCREHGKEPDVYLKEETDE